MSLAETANRRITVVGVGNILMTDEGFGPEVVRRVTARLEAGEAPAGADLRAVDGGVLGMKLLPYFQQSDAVIVVDALDAGAEPGALFRFTPEEAELKTSRPMSAHEMALPHVLAMAQLAGAKPEVIVIACQVQDIATPGIGLTQAVLSSVERAVELVFEETARLSASS